VNCFDMRHCNDSCFFFTAEADTQPDSSSTPSSVVIAVSVVVTVVIVALAFGVIVTASRKRAYGTTWFPEGFRNVLQSRHSNADSPR
jgi:hypothetical protein